MSAHARRDLARTVLEVTGSALPVAFVPRAPGDPDSQHPHTTLARTVLDREPRVSLEEGLVRTVAGSRRRPGPLPSWRRDAAR